MTGKTLSNGTLSLRFMQNAQRAKQEQTVELRRAKVNDEAEWEVSREVKEAWGLSSDSGQNARHSLTHEPSYLPFLFPSLLHVGHSSDDGAEPVASTSNTKVNGRRTFKKGQEVTTSAAKEEAEEAEEKAMPPPKQAVEVKQRSAKVGSKLSTKRFGKILENSEREGLVDPRKSDHPSVPVLSMISGEDTNAVGLDIRKLRKAEKAAPPVPATATSSSTEAKLFTSEALGNADKKPLGFLRPAGVDSPAMATKTSQSSKRLEKRGREEDGTIAVSASNTADKSETGQRKKKKKKIKGEQSELTGISMRT